MQTHCEENKTAWMGAAEKRSFSQKEVDAIDTLILLK